MKLVSAFSFLVTLNLWAQAPQVSPPSAPQTSQSPATEAIQSTSQNLDTAAHSNVFIYDPTGKRDPFLAESDIVKDEPVSASDPVVQTDQSLPKPTRGLEALEFFDLSQLKVTAIIWNTKKPRAMIIDPNGVMHTVKLKSRIGQRNGFVVAIREGEIVVVEYIQQDGNWTKTFNVLHLR